jgi:hypothetical protein
LTGGAGGGDLPLRGGREFYPPLSARRGRAGVDRGEVRMRRRLVACQTVLGRGQGEGPIEAEAASAGLMLPDAHGKPAYKIAAAAT